MNAFGRGVERVLRFFFGDRYRILGTATLAALILAYFNPQVIQTAIHNLIVAILNAILPIVNELLPYALVIGIIVYGFKTMLKGFGGGGSKKKKK